MVKDERRTELWLALGKPYVPLSSPQECHLSRDIINAATEHSELVL